MQINIKTTLYNILLLLLINSCVDPFNARLSEGDERLVVEGTITNLPGPYTVKITKSAEYRKDQEGINLGVKNANVFIIYDTRRKFYLMKLPMDIITQTVHL